MTANDEHQSAPDTGRRLGWNIEHTKEKLATRISDLEEALRPFAGAVFNDNGDMTVSPISNPDPYIKAYFVVKK